jgi:hypothetical protein
MPANLGRKPDPCVGDRTHVRGWSVPRPNQRSHDHGQAIPVPERTTPFVHSTTKRRSPQSEKRFALPQYLHVGAGRSEEDGMHVAVSSRRRLSAGENQRRSLGAANSQLTVGL